MTNEATVRAGLSIRKLSGGIVTLDYRSNPQQFNATVDGTKGPVPGAITVTTGGTDVDLSELTTPGLGRIMNLDPTNFVTYGTYDPDTGRFYPLQEVLPGETYPLRLSRSLGQELVGTGTAGGNTFRIKADTASCNVLLEIFEK